MTDRAMGSGRRKDYALDAFPRGEGGFGAVHRAKHKPTGQIVAFKKLREGVRHGKERFAREIAAMKSLEHPNIMPLLDDDPKGHWYVMPLADDSLWNLISVLDEPALETCFRQIAIGLAHAHAERMVHRDVKPQNILRIRDAAGTRWVVADWGLVQRPAAQSGEMLTKGAVGTEGFAAPESWQGVDLDLRADIYSLGRVIAWAMTREVPAPNIELRAPGKWRGLVAKMTATDRAARHSNLSEVIAELDGLHIAAMPNGQLIALGPDIVAEGDLRTAAGRDWTITLERLIIGDERALLRLTDSFETLPTHRRYVTLEQHGESRIIATAPRLAREGAGWAIGLTVAPRHERLHVDAIGADISFLDGFKVHRGRERLPDIFVAALSTDRGELLGSPDWGSDLRRRFDELGDTKLFERLVALEAMQMASIPFEDHGGPSVTPLRCVERIESIKLRPGRTPDRRLASVVAEINGIGRWKADVEIWVAFPSQKSKPNPAMGSVVWTENYKGQRWSAVLSGRDDAVWILRVLNGNTTQGDIYWDPDASAVASRTGALDREIVEKIVASLRRLTAGA